MEQIFALLKIVVVPLAWAAVPVALICLYDKLIAAPERDRAVQRVPGSAPVATPKWIRACYEALPYLGVAAVLYLSWNNLLRPVISVLQEVAVPLSWLAPFVGTLCAIDSWVFAPRRQIKARSANVPDPPFMRFAYAILPILVLAVVLRMITAESLDFSLVLFLLSVGTGLVWLLDAWLFRKGREAAVAAAIPGETPHEPGTVDYARSFFPVAFAVLVVRAFIFEPFRIPSDSMMPTLLDGDFIVVNKYAYGLRLPVVNEKVVDIGQPQRGDVVVFRHPIHPEVNYIKRLIGLPGDIVEVRDDRIIVNGQELPVQETGHFNDGCYANFRLGMETVGAHTHQVMSCWSPNGWEPAKFISRATGQDVLPACDRKRLRDGAMGGYVCNEPSQRNGRDSNDHLFPAVPAGHYLMIGDNRDNSEDSRVWSTVPDENLVGKATRIWFNFDMERSKWINWSRIGDGIE